MNRMSKMISAAALTLAVVLPGFTTFSSSAMALTKGQKEYCQNWAGAKAQKKANKKMYQYAATGAALGGLATYASSGKKKDIPLGVYGGATYGSMMASGKYDTYYKKYYSQCLAKYV